MSAFEGQGGDGSASRNFSAAAPKPEFVLRGHTSAVNCVTFVSRSTIAHTGTGSEDVSGGGGNMLCSGSLDGTLKLWDLSTRRAAVSVKSAHLDESIITVAVSADSRTLVSSGRDGQLRLWDIESNLEPVREYYTGARHFCNSAADCQHPHLILSPCTDESEVVLIDKRCRVPQVHLKAPSSLGMITSLQLDCCGTHGHSTLLGFEGGSVATVDLRNYSSVDLSPQAPLPSGLAENTTAPERRELNFQDSRSTMLFDSMHGRQPVMSMTITREQGSSEGFNLYTVGADRTMNKIVVDDKGESRCSEIKHPSAGTSSVSIRPDGKLLASGHWDSTARVFETKTLRPLAVLRHHRDCVFSVAWAPHRDANSNDFLATASKDGTIALWDLFRSRK